MWIWRWMSHMQFVSQIFHHFPIFQLVWWNKTVLCTEARGASHEWSHCNSAAHIFIVFMWRQLFHTCFMPIIRSCPFCTAFCLNASLEKLDFTSDTSFCNPISPAWYHFTVYFVEDRKTYVLFRNFSAPDIAEGLMVLFTLSQDPACWWVVALMPSLMILFGLCRGDAMSKARNLKALKL